MWVIVGSDNPPIDGAFTIPKFGAGASCSNRATLGSIQVTSAPVSSKAVAVLGWGMGRPAASSWARNLRLTPTSTCTIAPFELRASVNAGIIDSVLGDRREVSGTAPARYP